jgi:hypothetical protein
VGSRCSLVLLDEEAAMATTLDTPARAMRRVGQQAPPDEAELAAAAFLARYSSRALDACRDDLRRYFQWARVSEACGANVEHLGVQRGHCTLRISGRGNRPIARIAVWRSETHRLDGM